jgi:hypothetical protein
MPKPTKRNFNQISKANTANTKKHFRGIYKMKKSILSFVLLMLFASLTFSQNVLKNKKDEISPELKKEAVAFLRETATDVNTLRTLENRISFSSEIANLMWFNDEKEARAMFQAIINEFRQLLTQYNSQAIAAGTGVDADENGAVTSAAKVDIPRKFFKMLNVRQQIATSIAENDAQLAFDFLTDTALTTTHLDYRRQIEQSDGYFQTRLVSQIAAQDPAAALKYGRRTLAKGFTYEHINLLKKIYEKDQEKGAAFGEDILAKFKSADAKPDRFYYLNGLLSLGAENLEKGKTKTPMFSEQSLRELADLLAQDVLKRGNAEGSDVAAYISQIEKFSPARAAEVRQKLALKTQLGAGTGTGRATGSGATLGVGASSAPRLPRSMSNGESEQDGQKQMLESMQNLGAKQLSKEERQKVVGQARKIIAGIKEPTARLFALSALASQIATAGDKELAVQIMDEAKNTVNPQPKHYQEFMQIWLLAGGYAQVDADKAFPILEDAIFRINDTISAGIKVAEFMDTNNEILEDGEVQVGSFGGGMTRQLMSGLGVIDTTIQSLAKADFTRTKALTNKFDRSEARILAKMLVLRGIFGEKKEVTQE